MGKWKEIKKENEKGKEIKEIKKKESDKETNVQNRGDRFFNVEEECHPSMDVRRNMIAINAKFRIWNPILMIA